MLHLVRRFIAVVTSRRLTPAEQAEVAALLQPREESLFWDMQPADQRHGLRAARVVLESGGARVVARAGLLHDAGKADSRLGPVRRSMATILAGMHLPTPSRWEAYLRHGALGAALLQEAGCEALVVAYAHNHHGACPAGIDTSVWRLLQKADRV